jgi:hypothetical protein
LLIMTYNQRRDMLIWVKRQSKFKQALGRMKNLYWRIKWPFCPKGSCCGADPTIWHRLLKTRI